MNEVSEDGHKVFEMGEVYGDGHKIFLQMMSRGVMTSAEVREVASECGVDPEDTERLGAFVRLINSKIARFNMQILKGCEEENGTICCVMAMTVDTPISHLFSIYSPLELELFKKLIESIVESGEGTIGSIAALNLTDQLEIKMGKEEAQNFFRRLEEAKWIRQNEDGKILLSVRTIMELEPYILDVFEDDVKLCNICNKICFLGGECANCSSALFTKQRRVKKCPDCQAPWGQVVINQYLILFNNIS